MSRLRGQADLWRIVAGWVLRNVGAIGAGLASVGGCTGGSRPFIGLDALPLAVDVGRGAGLRVPEHEGMATDDLGSDRGVDVGQVEDPLLRGQLGMKDHLKEEIAQLVGQCRQDLCAGEPACFCDLALIHRCRRRLCDVARNLEAL